MTIAIGGGDLGVLERDDRRPPVVGQRPQDGGHAERGLPDDAVVVAVERRPGLGVGRAADVHLPAEALGTVAAPAAQGVRVAVPAGDDLQLLPPGRAGREQLDRQAEREVHAPQRPVATRGSGRPGAPGPAPARPCRRSAARLCSSTSRNGTGLAGRLGPGDPHVPPGQLRAAEVDAVDGSDRGHSGPPDLLRASIGDQPLAWRLRICFGLPVPRHVPFPTRLIIPDRLRRGPGPAGRRRPTGTGLRYPPPRANSSGRPLLGHAAVLDHVGHVGGRGSGSGGGWSGPSSGRP